MAEKSDIEEGLESVIDDVLNAEKLQYEDY